MWLDDSGLQAVDTVLQPGRTTEIDHLLADILASAPARGNTPTVCPTCRHDLVRRPLPRPDLFVSACPDGHGAWMTNDVADALRTFVETETGHIARRRHTIKLLNRVLTLGLFAGVCALALSYAVVNGVVPGPTGVLDSATTLSREDWVYFQQVVQLLEEGTSNRLRLEADLGAAPATYAARLTSYRERQHEFRGKLARLDTPSRLRAVHDKLLVATDHQIRFYEAFVAAKTEDPSVDLRRMAKHPDARGTDQNLWAAWHLIVQTYPKLDSRMSQTIEQHLCAYDVLGNL
jgi:hypothetical protein